MMDCGWGRREFGVKGPSKAEVTTMGWVVYVKMVGENGPESHF